MSRGLAVLAGWYATVIAAVLIWIVSLSDSTPESCSMWCFSPRAGAVLGTAFAGTFLLPVSVVLALITLAVLAAKRKSGLAAGNAAAAVGLGGGAVVVALGMWVRLA
jgi:hypothetical protein